MPNPLSAQILGNASASAFLEKLAILGHSSQLSGSYILAGHDQSLTTKAAHWLFQALACLDDAASPCGACQHCQALSGGLFPDLYQVQVAPGKQGINLEQIKDLIAQLSLSALAGNYRFVLIHHAESLSLSAANGLLKTLEEPGARIVIVLLASDPATLPATIVSRSQLIHFRHIPTNTIFDHLLNSAGLKRSLAKSIAHLSMGKFGLAENYLRDEALYQQRLRLAEQFLNALTADLSARLRLAEHFIKDASIDNYSELLVVMQTIIRDLFLLNLNQPELIHNDSLRGQLTEVCQRFTLKRLVEASRLLAQAKTYLAANVNPQLALENVLINL